MRKPSIKEQVNEIPLVERTWVYGERMCPFWIQKEKGEGYLIPWLSVVIDYETGFILNSDLSIRKPTAAKRLTYLTKLMLHPPKSSGLYPHRPTDIYFERRELTDEMRPLLRQAGIKAYHHPELDLVDLFMSNFTDVYFETGIKPPPGILSQKDVTPNIAKQFFQAAANFFAAEPWIWLKNDDILKIQLGAHEKPIYVSVMGQSAITYGISCHESWEEIVEIFNDPSATDVTSPRGRHVLMYNEPPYISVEDVIDAENYGWIIPSLDSFPTPLHLLPDVAARPNALMLDWYEAVLQAIPRFLQDHLISRPDGCYPPTEAVIKVKTHTGKKEVRITYPGGNLDELASSQEQKRLPAWDGEPLADEIPFDHRLMEMEMTKVVEELEGYEPIFSSKLRQAQQIIYDAWEVADPEERIRLARKALKISPDCADAYGLLAEEAETYLEALEYYEAGVEAGKRALGEDFFEDEENKGHFWGILETRPYMRALAGVGNTLWELNRKDEAEKTFRYLLKLNPNDNQGIRYSLLLLLFDMGKHNEAGKLTRKFSWDPSAEMIYSRILLDYQEKGASPKLEKDLKKAFAVNPFVQIYLVGLKRLPGREISRFAMGSEEEAIHYAKHYRKYWRRVPGAVEWLAQNS